MSFTWKVWILIILVNLISTGMAKSKWTDWQNTDSPNDGDGDKEEGYYSCGTHHQPTATECRVVDSGVIFNNDTLYLAPDVLYKGCTRKGIICRNHDQEMWNKCHDYEIRFYCPETESDDDPRQFWLIALVGAACVTVPLLLIVAYQCIHDFGCKQHRLCTRYQISARQLRRQTNNTNDTVEYNLPPPSYDTLFGSTDFQFTTENSANDGLSTCYHENRSNNSVVIGSGESNYIRNTAHQGDEIRRSVISSISSGSIHQGTRGQQFTSTSSSNSANVLGNNEVITQKCINPGSSRRFLGMHISPLVLFQSERSQETTTSPSLPEVTPPPSYADLGFSFEKLPQLSPKHNCNTGCNTI